MIYQNKIIIKSLTRVTGEWEEIMTKLHFLMTGERGKKFTELSLVKFYTKYLPKQLSLDF